MQFKKIDPNQKLYHHFEIEVSKFALYDDELDMPIVHGSRNLVDATVRKLSKEVVIIYYKRDTIDDSSYKRKAKFIGGKLKPA